MPFKNGRWIRLTCGETNCKKYTVVQVLCDNYGTCHNKRYGSFDIRNIGFVCDEHNEDYREFYKGSGNLEKYGPLGDNRALI